MSEPLMYLHDWWRWWGNPLIGIHESQLVNLPYPLEKLRAADHLLFLEMRSLLNLPELPDHYMVERPQLRSVALGNISQTGATFGKLATLSLNNSILQANAQKWIEHYGVKSPEEIRQVIQWQKEIPYALKPWRESLLITLNQGDSYSMHMESRALLSLGAYLMSFYPNFYTRWCLMAPFEVTLILKSCDPIPEEVQASFENWIEPMLNGLHESILSTYPSDDIETLDLDDTESDDSLETLDFEESNNNA